MQGFPLPLANTGSIQAPVLRPQPVPPWEDYFPFPSGTAAEARYVLPYVYSPQSSASTSLAQNAVSSPGYAPAVLATPPPPPDERLLQRVAQLELRQMQIDKSTLKVGMHFLELAENIILSSANHQRTSAKFHADVRKLLQDFGYNDGIKIQKAFLKDNVVAAEAAGGWL
ncbi:hypothetical protein B0H10DRAFT_1949245 [Mycena sp. CBHHK59/15]|nr:hypothetical protein B0H10DRAFT_1949245 [Mycena sp. CBHHK59/15]